MIHNVNDEKERSTKENQIYDKQAYSVQGILFFPHSLFVDLFCHLG